ncbi:bifunctional riboflavin kinase/FAD synthetase [Branchiibius sp. NY16-3462-2]|uniref:bifunctional riboflavin kinase/FAD synthetase n=1 Tax=Branchiibius sp. NY16-3462-2 TaxID=1807500 RepID=UPI00079336C6|nr:bifunctional riboflavin kinase/FAD synthetase [Branchiibius sp. NY16-3462-2]KYH43823.1 bifunctional riboflavin kinase/FMN adenylyltransferase [Branchiibius sp. NY16-3462-2]
MLRLTALDQVPADLQASVVTIGNFDGVHRGHRALLTTLVQRAQADHLTSVAVTFEPHPLAVLHPDRAPKALTGLDDRLDLLEELGVDVALVLPFTLELAAQTPREFVEEVFVDALHARVVMVGRDMRFGVRNSGDVHTLTELGQEFGYDVAIVDDVGTDKRFSSTDTRARMVEGDVAGAAEILGRTPEVHGVVVRGLQRGRELGYPTANLAADATGMVPEDGVYAGWLVRDRLPESDPDHRMPAAISVGTNPTFDDVHRRTVEAYVLDRDDLDLYGESVRVQFVQRVRGNTRFTTIEALIEQIGNDVDKIRDLLSDCD